MADKTRLAKFLKHVDKYGPDGVMEAAAFIPTMRGAGGEAEVLTLPELICLQKHIDSKRQKHAPKIRLSAETRVKRLLKLEEEESSTDS